MHTRRIRLMPVHLHDSKTIHNEGIARHDGYPDFQLLLTLSGRGIVNTDIGKQLTIEPGDILFIPADVGHSYYQTGDEKWMITYITFNGASITEGLPYAVGLPREISVLKKDEIGEQALGSLHQLFRLASDEYAERAYPDDLILHTILYRTLDLLYGVMNNSLSGDAPNSLSSIPDVLSYIGSNLSTPLSIKKIAADTERTVCSIYDAFSKEFDMTPWEYITRERLKRVKDLLLTHPEMSVYEAGLSAGITSKTQLNRTFKKYYGTTPGKYRELSDVRVDTGQQITAEQLPVYLTHAQETVIETEECWDTMRKGNTWQLMLCLDGTGVLVDKNDSEQFIRPGFMCLLTPESECRYAPVTGTGESWRVIRIQFSGKYAKELINALRLSSIMVIPSEFSINIEHRFSPSLEYSFLESFDHLCAYSYKTDDVSVLHNSVILHELITYTSIVADMLNDAIGDEKKLLPVIDIINIYYNRKLTLDTLAEAIGVNVPTLIRLFKNVYSTTPVEYITSVRIIRAKRQLLRHPGRYISEIAKQTGFSGSSYFISTFKKYEGMTPEEYRNLYL